MSSYEEWNAKFVAQNRRRRRRWVIANSHVGRRSAAVRETAPSARRANSRPFDLNHAPCAYMDIHNRIIGRIGQANPRGDRFHLDPSVFIEYLLLFDKIVLRSVMLTEFRALLEYFGYAGVN